MSKDGFNGASKGINDKVCFSTKDMDRGARALCKAMAGLDGKNIGDVASQLIWEKATQRFHPATIKLIMEQADMDWEPSQVL